MDIGKRERVIFVEPLKTPTKDLPVEAPAERKPADDPVPAKD